MGNKDSMDSVELFLTIACVVVGLLIGIFL